MGLTPQPKGDFRILGEFRKGSQQAVSRIQGRGERGEGNARYSLSKLVFHDFRQTFLPQ